MNPSAGKTDLPDFEWFRVISVWAILDDFIRNCWNIAERQKSDEIRLCEGSKTQKPLKIWKRVKSDEIAISNIFLRFLLENSLEMAYFLPLWRSVGSAFFEAPVTADITKNHIGWHCGRWDANFGILLIITTHMGKTFQWKLFLKQRNNFG